MTQLLLTSYRDRVKSIEYDHPSEHDRLCLR